MLGNPAVGANPDGRLEVFGRWNDDTLRHISQTGRSTPPFWTAWENLGGQLSSDPVVSRNWDQRLEVFVRWSDQTVRHIWQTGQPTAPFWSAWENLGGGPWVGTPAVAANADGRLELFIVAPNGTLWHSWQTGRPKPPFWSSWADLGGVGISGDPVLGVDLDGRLQVFIRALNGASTSLWSIRQAAWYSRPMGTPTDSREWWSAWENLNGQVDGDPCVGTNWDGRLEAFVRAADHGFYHLWQQPAIQWLPGSTALLPIARADNLLEVDLGASTLHDGTLYVFFGDRPAPYFEDPIGFVRPTGGASEGSQGIDFALDRDASKDFAGFDYLESDPTRLPFRLDTPAGHPTLGQDQTPTGAFAYEGTVYVFAYALLDSSGIPRPKGSPNATGYTLLASSDHPSEPFRTVFTQPALGGLSIPQNTGKFAQVAPMVVSNSEIPGVPKHTVDGVIMLGQGAEYLGTPGVHLAWMPLRPKMDPVLSEMLFYKGNTDPDPEKWWTDKGVDTTLLFETRFSWSSISVGRIRSTGRWIVLYQKTTRDFENPDPAKRHDGIYARIGASPWDWSPEVKIFDPDREKAWGPNSLPRMIDEAGGSAECSPTCAYQQSIRGRDTSPRRLGRSRSCTSAADRHHLRPGP